MRDALAEVRRYYEERLRRFGATARGVDWDSDESQRLRFQQLLRLTEGTGPFSLNDYGCGCGELAGYLVERGLECTYRGFDISAAMLAAARETHEDPPRAAFVADLDDLPLADFTVASGLFNVKLRADPESWRQYVLETLETLARLSRRGFAFNALTTYSDRDRMRSDLYYADPLHLFDHCKRRYSRWVALLHDYGLYEFTLLVKADERISWQQIG